MFKIATRQVIYESRVTAYNVVYEYGGKQFSAQLPSDPGQFVRLQITPLASPPSYAPPADQLPITSHQLARCPRQ
jgi:hypothetical protein